MIILPVERRLDWKHAPVVLISIILLNILIFFLYQANDQQKRSTALQEYLASDMLEKEWPLYKDYLREQGDSELLTQMAELYVDEEYGWLASYILQDSGFYQHLEANGRDLFYQSYYVEWSEMRPVIQGQIDDMSYRKFGVVPSDLSLVDLIISQFLHADFMHLLGNMMFLMLCGFVVEAAIGHLPFLGFYLLGGVIAGLAQAAMDFTSDRPGIGASGAVSAVMAMYLVLYRLQSIRFFYWFYLVVGYFRAPALMILPVYVGIEIFKLWNEPDSNVAYMAHVGGFIAGGISIGILAVFRPGILNTDYLESPEDEDEPYRLQLADIYAALEKYRFDQAYRLVQQAIKTHGQEFELLLLRHNLLKIRGGEPWQKSLNLMLQQTGLTREDVQHQERIWKETREQPERIHTASLIRSVQNFSRLDNLISAEEIFRILQKRQAPSHELQRLANLLAQASQRLNIADTQRYYVGLSQQLERQSVEGVSA